ncbi:uncharacterized protein LOC124893049 [Capsicum annuum]|uniref:uncharacterized protein LOC124893049 n=1 Tax=Capsicum annuum TaxID=4072 RepID=UPI001FB08BF9|nr:uncharacterized protein LOC124893049 [Capsicum annuum]
MNKYNVNGHKFCTEESSKYYKSNNIGVWVKGDTSNKDGDVDYYGVLQEILELDFPGWPHKKLILFRCKWFDPTPKIGTRVDPHYKIVEVKHTRQYGSYDPFIIAQNVKQVYYAPYPLRTDKSNWWVVIKTKPVGRVEVEDALDVAYQNDISSVQEIMDIELENELDHPDHILEEIDIVEETPMENEEEELSLDDGYSSYNEYSSDEEDSAASSK